MCEEVCRGGEGHREVGSCNPGLKSAPDATPHRCMPVLLINVLFCLLQRHR